MNSASAANRKKRLRTLIWAVLISMGVAGPLSAYVSDAAHIPWTAIVAGLTLVATLVYLRKGGSTHIAAWVVVVAFFLCFTVGTVNTGGFEGPIAALAPALPLLAIMLFSPKAGWTGAVLTFFLLSFVAVLQLSGLTRPLLIDQTGLVTIQYFVITIACVVLTWIVADFSQKTNEALATNRQNSRTDFVTGVANRRQINDTLEQEAERAKRSDNHLSVILIDVDHFKRFNDANGHLAGDQCLSAVAEVLSASAKRSIDLVGRYGGDEFIIVLPSTDAFSATGVAEKARAEMLNRSLYYDGKHTDKVSLTLGVASLQGRAIKSTENLVKLADDALLHGKTNGRNATYKAIFNAQSQHVTFEREQR